MSLPESAPSPQRGGVANQRASPDPKSLGVQTAIAAAAGLVSGLVVLIAVLGLPTEAVTLIPVGSPAVQIVLHLIAAALLGAIVQRTVACRPGGHAAVVSVGALIGLLWWLVGSLTLAPLFDAASEIWSAETAEIYFPNLVAALLFGAISGLLTAVLSALLDVQSAPLSAALTTDQEPTRVVILGGGFAGVGAAQQLEQRHPHQLGIQATLVSESNSLLFTPMLAEVAGSALEPQHISSPVRASIPRTRFVRATVSAIDTDAKVVYLDGSSTAELTYDHLVVSLGSVPTFHNLPGIDEHGMTLKSLDDAVKLRNRAIGMLELADACPDPIERRRLLTFVVAGGGFAGTETAAELFDLAHSTLRYYPNVAASELRIVLVHSRDRILPEIGPELADYALQKLRTRGIEFALGVRISGATADHVALGDGSTIPTRTLVWTAGNRPNPLLETIPANRTRQGALETTSAMAVPGLDGVWALGDNAAIPDPASEGTTYPPTAQHASRQGKKVADNIVAVLEGKEPAPFKFEALGILVALGHRTAVAEIFGRRFSGLIAWLMWRSIYLAKLPGLEQKVRVALDWTLDLFFPRDITLTGKPPSAVRPTEPPASQPAAAPTPPPAIQPAAAPTDQALAGESLGGAKHD